jgi:hypothetical protein
MYFQWGTHAWPNRAVPKGTAGVRPLVGRGTPPRPPLQEQIPNAPKTYHRNHSNCSVTPNTSKEFRSCMFSELFGILRGPQNPPTPWGLGGCISDFRLPTLSDQSSLQSKDVIRTTKSLGLYMIILSSLQSNGFNQRRSNQ